MEKITKKINLSCFVRDESGKYKNDFVLTGPIITDYSELLQKHHLPNVTIVEGDTEKHIMRYGDVVSHLSWLKDFIRNGETYRLCVRRVRGEEMMAWVKFSKEYPDCDDMMQDVLMFFDGEIDLFIEPVLEDPQDESGHTVGDVVFVSKYAEEFEKRFIDREHAKAFYCFAVDALKDADTCDALGCNVQSRIETVKPYTSTNLFLEESVEDMGDVYPVGEYAFCGEYDPDVTYEPYSVVWKNGAISVFTGTEWIVIGDVYPDGESIVQATVPSTLLSLRRQRTATDLHGETLPFYIDTSDPNASPELPFIEGAITNVIECNGGFYFDRLEKEPEYLKYETSETGEEIVLITDKEDGEYVRFTYSTGNFYDTASDKEEPNSGIMMSEIHPYTLRIGFFRVFSEAGDTYTYVDVDYSSGRNGGDETVEGAEATYEAGRVLPDFANKTELIRYDGTLGMHDVYKSGDRVFVERGRSAFFEPFNILGEVNSVEDIENYRDDYFRIRGKND